MENKWAVKGFHTPVVWPGFEELEEKTWQGPHSLPNQFVASLCKPQVWYYSIYRCNKLIL